MATSGKRTATEGFLAILPSTKKSADIPEKDDLYGWLVGSWHLDIVSHDEEGITRRTAGEAHVARVLEGRAVQDVFINPRRSDRGPSMPAFANWYGTTIRIYDPTVRAWRIWWFNPQDGVRAELTGRRRDGDIVQEGQFPDGTPIRWTFSDITRDAFVWRGERRGRDGKSWQLQVEFHGRRSAESAAEPPRPRRRVAARARRR
jgi:hypothetical protein